MNKRPPYKKNIPPYLTKILKYVFLGLLIYSIFIAGIAIHYKFWLSGVDLGIFQSTGEASDFIVSFIASALESVLFFICSGVIAFLLSISRPEYEDFETKLYYLFPRVNQSDKGKEYCKSSINKLACISPKTTIQVSLDEYSEEYKAFRMSTDQEYHLLNLHNNIAFQDSLKVKQRLDKSEICDFGNNHWGQIKRIRTIANHQTPDECKNLIDKPISLDKKSFEFPFNVEIRPNDNLILDINTWTWNNFLVPQTARVGRFTENFVLSLKNNTGKNLELLFQGEIKKFENGEFIELHNGIATPQDQVEYQIFLEGGYTKNLCMDN
ncbi:hypothetical protein I6F53_15110 [Pseudoalteromonas sp. SWN29]|uniref:hypothetical protein n=1 Tax=Pseudoalteromonas sp. SWN29 TaxID=2792064 RepID=UPI0018CC8E4E|nr:hypothetical protein [Pseudoalteromonas sp. SWN29]MBH0028305.1 hypothetical protein [Pseudoalteromonas sp. SWN29]